MTSASLISAEEFGTEYTASFRSTIQCLIHLGAPPDDAREHAQSAWVRAWERRGQLQNRELLVPWVHQIARSIWFSARRSGWHRYKGEMPMFIEAPKSNPIARIDAYTILESLGAEDREMLKAYYFMGIRHEQLSTGVGIPPSSMRVRMRRAVVRAGEVARRRANRKTLYNLSNERKTV